MPKAVIMAGGEGTRLQSIAKDIPKPMFPILDKPILEYQVDSLKRSGIQEIILVVGHLGQAIKDYFGDGSKWDVKMEYLTEDKPLGTAGALFYLRGRIPDDFLFVFGDLVLDIDWNRFLSFHKEKGGSLTLYGHPNAHPFDSDLLVTDGDGKVTRIIPKNTKRDFDYHNFVNAGVYCMNPRLLESIPQPGKMDFEKEILAAQIRNGNVYAYKSTEYVRDMGTPDRLQAVTQDLVKGVVESRSLRNKQRAIFLDRDGTVNEYVGFLRDAGEFKLIDGAVEAIRRINASPYLVIVATNQPVVARGEVSVEGLGQIHRKMETELGKEGAYIDDLFYCPHHPHKGYAGEVPELKIDCACRKPKTGMLLLAAEKYNIDLTASWYVGDTTVDIQTGMNAGMRTVLVRTGEAGKDGRYPVEADYEVPSLLQAVDLILKD